MLADGAELALVDVREELTFSKNHLLWARNVPLSRLELRFARLVPLLTTRIVLCDDGDGLVERAAAILANAGYTNLSYLDGGIAAWLAAGFVLFSGVHVPSKAFGEFVEHDSRTPSISAVELDAMMTSKCSTAGHSTNTRESRFRPVSMSQEQSWFCAYATLSPRRRPPS